MNRPHEGATLGGLHVLTDAELNRTIKHALLEQAQREKQRKLDRRRAKQRLRDRLRYRRYRTLATRYGIPRRSDWSSVLPELERRAAAE